MTIRSAAVLLLVAGCAESTDPLDDRRVPVTVEVTGLQSAVVLLLSAEDGRVADVLDVDAPAIIEVMVPAGGSISTRFPGTPSFSAYVLSFADLAAGDYVRLRPLPWIGSQGWPLYSPPPAPEGHWVEVDNGCSEVAFTFVQGSGVTQPCTPDPIRLGAMLIDPDETVVATATLTVTRAGLTNLTLPPLARWTSGLRYVDATVVGVEEPVAVTLRGRLGAQSFREARSVRSPPVASSARQRELPLYPFAYDALEVTVTAPASETSMVQTLVGNPDVIEVDVASELPAVAAFAVPGSVAWSATGPVDAVDVVAVLYGTGPWLHVTRPAERFWVVIKKPAESGSWVAPDVPDRLSDWRDPAAGTRRSYVVLVEHEADRATALEDPVGSFPPNRPAPGAGRRFQRAVRATAP